jgi:hypothetical protein
MSGNFQHPNASLYCALMEQLKLRIDAVIQTTHLVQAGNHYLSRGLAFEFCLLQLRFCCENIALGIVAIHTDVPQRGRLREEWNARRILTMFEQLKPEFFPKPIKSERQQSGTFMHLDVKGALTKNELLKMYKRMGDVLHSGAFKNAARERVADFEMINSFVSKLVILLNDHTYLLNDGKIMIRVLMQNVADGKVWINVLERVSSASPST